MKGRLLKMGHEPVKHSRICQQKQMDFPCWWEEGYYLYRTYEIGTVQEYMRCMVQDHINNDNTLSLSHYNDFNMVT